MLRDRDETKSTRLDIFKRKKLAVECVLAPYEMAG